MKKKIDDIAIDFKLKLTNIECKIMTEIKKHTSQRPNVTCMNSEKLDSLNDIVRDAVSVMDQLIVDKEELSEKMMSIEQEILSIETLLKSFSGRTKCEQMEKSLHFELIDDEAISYDANPLLCQVDGNSYPPITFLDSETSLQEQPYVNLSMISMSSDENFDQDNENDSEWLYIANRNPDIPASTIIRLLQQKFGLNDIKLDVLSQSSSTYRSFKVLVHKSKVKSVLDLKNWPNDFYVRRFKLGNEAVFQEAPRKKEKKKHFINNPRNQITRSSTTM